jgi:hypothetical protein
MKKRFKLLAGLTALMMSAQILAFDGQGYQILSETHKVTGAQDGGMVHLTPSEKKSPQNVAASVTTKNVVTKVMQLTKLESFHGVNIINMSNKSQVYTYELFLNSGWATGDHTIQVRLDPGGRFNDMIGVYLAVQPPRAANYDVFAYTKITGPESTYADTHAVLTATN